MTTKPKIEHVWKPRWWFLDEVDLLYFFCELRFTISKAQWEERWFPGTLRRHFVPEGQRFRWAPKLAFVDAKDLCYLSQFVECEVNIGDLDRKFDQKLLRHFKPKKGSTDVLVWSPDLDWLHISELPHVVRYWPIVVTDERWNEGTFPAGLRQHFTAREIRRGRGRPPGSKSTAKKAPAKRRTTRKAASAAAP